MSAKLGAITARNPWSSIAHGACSRLEPHPKFAPGEQDRGPGVALVVEDEVGVLAPLVEQERAEPGALDPLQVLRGDDLVGVDVGSVQRQGACPRCA